MTRKGFDLFHLCILAKILCGGGGIKSINIPFEIRNDNTCMNTQQTRSHRQNEK